MALDVGQYTVFWTIRIIVLIAFYLTGRWISSRDESGPSYWLGVSPLIILYSLAEGLRWNRDTDYAHYYQDLTNSIVHDNSELLYTLWISFFKWAELPFWMGFVFYSFILIFAFLYLIRKFPQTAELALPLFFILTSIQSENLIRQFFALAFLIFAIAFFFEKRYIGMMAMLILSEGIHFSAIVPVFFLLFSVLLARKTTPKSPEVAVWIFVVLYLLWDVSYFAILANTILGLIPETGTRADGYIQSATWFTAEGSLAMKSAGQEFAGRSISLAVVQFPAYLFVIIWGFYATNNDYNLRACYWCAYIAIILDITRGDIESYLRFFHWIAFIIAIPVGAIYSELLLSKKVKLVSLFFLIVYFGYNLFFSRLFMVEPFGYAFIWDR